MRRTGLGLVEVVIGAVVLAGALVVVFQALGMGVRGTEQIGDELAGAQAASDLLDLVASVPATRLTSTSGEVPPAALAEPLGLALDRVALPAGFTARVAIDVLPATSDGIPAGRLKRVRVQVRWPAAGKTGAERGVTLVRLVTDEVGLEP